MSLIQGTGGMEQIEIRESAPSDWPSIEVLYSAAFPEEDLLPLVQELFQQPSVAHSLVGSIGASFAGHCIFSTCAVTGCTDTTALLGPIAVAPAWQRHGVGTALVGAGLERLQHHGITRVFVLGDPAYYGRLGFVHESDVNPPYALPAEWRCAWQSLRLGTAGSSCRGTLSVPRSWLRPALWAP